MHKVKGFEKAVRFVSFIVSIGSNNMWPSKMNAHEHTKDAQETFFAGNDPHVLDEEKDVKQSKSVN